MKGFANVGDVLAGKYRVDKILGIGGMGMVVRAINLDLDQRVALKFMLPQALESAEASARFIREARAAGRLTGEHICRVTDIGRFDSGAPYIVMEYLEGYDLMTLLKRRGPLPLGEAIDYILEACEGMAEAHAVGIVHRDLKPDNLFLASRADGTRIIKVLDFGISKAAVTGLATKTGDVLGSPAYMAPEQMQSTKDVDARADIWSLGVVLHQLISGKLAFHGDTLPQLCLAVLNDAPKRLTELRADVPPPLADAVLRCLEKDREKRFSDVGQLAEALAPFGGSTATGAVTRVHSLLRGRAGESMSLPPTAEEFAAGGGDVLPTLVGESMPHIPSNRDTPVHRPLAGAATELHEARPGITTLSATAGQSMQMLPIGVIGAVAGSLAMVALIVVMVMRRGDRDDAPTAPQPQPAAQPRPTVEPIVEPPPPPAPLPAPVTEPAVATDEVDDVDDDRPRRKRDRDKDKANDKDEDDDIAKGSAAATTPTDAGLSSPIDASESQEDKWGRMLDDEPPPEPQP